jgi:hypothetical protein
VIVSRLVSLLEQPPLRHDETFLLVDETGIGAALCDWLRAAGAEPIGITIHGGDAIGRDGAFRLRVPKKDLASRTVGLFQAGRIKIAEDLDLAPALLQEMRTFRARMHTATGYTAFEAAGNNHDDLIMCVSMALWWAEVELENRLPVNEETADLLSQMATGGWQPWNMEPLPMDRHHRRRA